MYLVVDKKQTTVRDETRNQEEGITGIFADGRKDKTKVLIAYETTGRYYQRWVKQENMYVTCEPDGRFLFHYTPEPGTRRSKAARQAAVGLHEQ